MTIVLIVIIIALACLTAWLFVDNRKQRSLVAQGEEEKTNLLADYERRVNEQENLLKQYSELEEKFENAGKLRVQTLSSLDQVESEKSELEAVNRSLEQQSHDLQAAHAEVVREHRQKIDVVRQLAGDIRAELQSVADATVRSRVAGIVSRLSDISELGSSQVISCHNQVTMSQVADVAVAESQIRADNHVEFALKASPTAAYALLNTNLNIAAHAIALLLDNAQKFTSEGSVTLRLDEADSKALFIVEDTGFGVPAEEAERIFKPFVKLNSFFDGLGLGLTVARNLAERLGGSLHLDTSYTAGARFVLTLPCIENTVTSTQRIL